MAYTYKVKQGDTLNKIAQQHGFSNYKDAGIANVPSGNFDLIRPDEEITLGNYDPNKISTIGTGSPVLSSKDNTQTYREDSKTLDGVTNIDSPTVADKPVVAPATDAKTTETTKKDGTSDAPLDKLTAKLEADQVKFEADAVARKQEYEMNFRTSLANIDSTLRDTISQISTSYDKRIAEQRRINDISISSVKAYGLGGGGRFTPISYKDAVSTREQESADKVATLESERTSLIQQAKNARDNGESQLLRQKMTDLQNVDVQIRNAITASAVEGERQYRLLRQSRIDEENKQKLAFEKASKAFLAVASGIADEYRNATPEEKMKMVEKYAKEHNLDELTVNGILQTATDADAKSDKDLEYKDAQIEASKALKTNRENDTSTKPTNEEIKSEAHAGIATLMGAKDKSGKLLFTDANGMLTPAGFKKLQTSALQDRISRKDFLETYGSYLDAGEGSTYAGYGLTQAEINKLLN